MLKIAICDDEKYYQDKIYQLLKNYLRERQLEANIDIFVSGETFLQMTDNLVKYDIVFMDISMEEIDGIQTARKMRMYHSNTYLVFVTSFIDYVLDGYKVEALRYVMKDSLDLGVAEAMNTVLRKMEFCQVTFSFIEGKKRLYIDNILYVESRKHKSVFTYLEAERVNYQIYEKLDCIEKELNGYGFLRIHKSYLVNMKHIQKISNYKAVLDCGEELPIPRLKFQAVREAFVLYKGAL